MTGRRTVASAAAFVAAAFLARTAFGLCYEFWAEDELQIFLIGLKYSTTGAWPYFGPDVVYTSTQIPGALQGLLVGVPLRMTGFPEAPFLLLNLLSCASLGLLAWYIGRRLPAVPAWFLWPTLFFNPWTMNFSTHIVNPSYVLTGAVLFFVGAFDVLAYRKEPILDPRLAFASMGAGVLWVYQLHLSYVLLLPFAAAALVVRIVESGWGSALAAGMWFTLGAGVTGITLVPTVWRDGAHFSGSATAANIRFTPSNLTKALEIVARFFSFSSFELPRFLGNNNEARLAFLERQPWSVPFAVIAGGIGLLQPIVLLFGMFRSGSSEWRAVRRLTLATLALICASFLVSVKDPASHTFYVTLPVAMLYGFYVWDTILQRRWVRVIAAALLVCGAIVHVAIAVDRVHTHSLFKDRALVMRAIRTHDYRVLGERRPVLWELEAPRAK